MTGHGHRQWAYIRAMTRGDRTLGELLAEARAARGMPSQKAMADELGVTQHQISRWLADRAFPEPDARPRLADYLGLSPDDLDALDPKAGKGRPRVTQKAELARLSATVGRLMARVEALERRRRGG